VIATPVLTTSQLTLAPFVAGDAPDVFAWASNPRVAEYTTWVAHRSLADAEAFVNMVMHCGPDEHCWAIRLSVGGPGIGAIELALIAPDAADIHFALAESMWNRGLTTEAATAVLDWGFRTYPRISRVITNAAAANVASRRVMEKCGMRLLRTEFANWRKHAGPVEVAVYCFSRAEHE
jgi:ribosomal-protein-alanine N-acetyltransferase